MIVIWRLGSNNVKFTLSINIALKIFSIYFLLCIWSWCENKFSSEKESIDFQ